jgi:hypothetical protein
MDTFALIEALGYTFWVVLISTLILRKYPKLAQLIGLKNRKDN